MVRINKYLSQCNLGSRRYVETLIRSGKISVNSEPCLDLARQIDPEKDSVSYLSKTVRPKTESLYIMLNKPVNYLVTSEDDYGRKTVFDLIPKFDTHLFPIGRLDYKSEGLLLITSDGDFANEIIHPRYKLPKTYRVAVKGEISKEQLQELRSGVLIDSRKTLPAEVFVKKRSGDSTKLKITIREGRKRQIRRMFSAVGSEVVFLKRTQLGDLRLDKLPSGRWRYLTPKEVHFLKTYHKREK